MFLKSPAKYYIFSLLFILFFILADGVLTNEIKTLESSKYSSEAQNLKKSISQAIKDKSFSTKNIALSLSENQNFKEFLKKKSPLHINLKEISNKIKQHSNYKHVWIQLIDKNGYSRYRSWSKKKDDLLLNKRKELALLIKKPKISSVMSVGIFDMTFKSIIPIFEEKEFLGFIEVITKTNSIAKNFEENGLDLIILSDKKYKQQIKKPFTKDFIQDYYVANLNAKPLLKNLVNENLEELILNYDFKIIDKYLVTTYHKLDIQNKEMGYFILFKKLNKIDMSSVKNLEHLIKIIGFLLLLVIASIFFIYYYFNKSKYTKDLEKEVEERTKKLAEATRRYRQIFEESKAIKILINPITQEIVDANNSALKFYGYSLEEIKSLKSSDINTASKDDLKKIFSECLNLNNHVFHCKHRLSNNQIKDVEVYATPIDINNEKFIYSVIRDATDEIKAKKELEENQKLLNQQAKMASMGEMLENIAHQWRQPLSAISTAASGIMIKKDFGDLDDDFLEESTTLISKSTSYLSETIEDFRNFFRQDREQEELNIDNIIDNSINIYSSKLKNANIKVSHHRCDITIYGYKNELTQVFLNILNNSQDAFLNKDIKEEKHIQIESNIINQNLFINIYDNAGGIDNKIIDKVFEPYFTTKHKSQGTGIGLYMSQQIILKHFDGELSVNNSNFRVNNKTYFGAKFTIKIPIKEKL